MYLLHIKDAEDQFLYLTLMFENKDDRTKAYDLIEKFDSDWYANEISPEEELGWSYIEYLEHMLKQNGMLKYSIEQDTIYIR